jgi:hypothetical protein
VVAKASGMYCKPLGLCVVTERERVKRSFHAASPTYFGVNTELERIRKEVVTAKFHMFHYLPGMTGDSDSNFRLFSFGNI